MSKYLYENNGYNFLIGDKQDWICFTQSILGNKKYHVDMLQKLFFNSHDIYRQH